MIQLCIRIVHNEIACGSQLHTEINIVKSNCQLLRKASYLIKGRPFYHHAGCCNCAVILSADDSVAVACGDVYKRQSILVSQVLGSNYIGPIAVVAYSYMALVPIIQPMVIKLLTTKKERCIHMEYKPATVSKKAKIIFPIVVTFIAGLVAPMSVSLDVYKRQVLDGVYASSP